MRRHGTGSSVQHYCRIMMMLEGVGRACANHVVCAESCFLLLEACGCTGKGQSAFLCLVHCLFGAECWVRCNRLLLSSVLRNAQRVMRMVHVELPTLYIYIYTRTCLFIYLYTYTYTHTYMHVYIYMHVYNASCYTPKPLHFAWSVQPLSSWANAPRRVGNTSAHAIIELLPTPYSSHCSDGGYRQKPYRPHYLVLMQLYGYLPQLHLKTILVNVQACIAPCQPKPLNLSRKFGRKNRQAQLNKKDAQGTAEQMSQALNPLLSS